MDVALPMTPSHRRLQTFFTRPLPEENEFCVSNSPIKFAEAGFSRPHCASEDEVECSMCGVKYKGWSGESPFAVHRTLNPNCPFLNTPSTSDENYPVWNDIGNRRNELENVRRQLFPDSEESSGRKMCVPDFEHPFLPKQGSYLMLFESHRLLTFLNPLSSDAAIYAEGGFVYNTSSKSVFCIFCNTELNYQPTNSIQLESKHAKKSPKCPFVLLFDVGNVSRSDERKIREKVRAQNQCGIFNSALFAIRHPEFENDAARIGTFSTWPKLLASVFPASMMSESGLFYTGFNDKVKCFACGVGLYDWSPEAVPAEQHAKASPQCVFLLQSKGTEFINSALNVQLLVKADHEETLQPQEQDAASSATDSGVSSSLSSKAATLLSTSSPGSPVLDMEAIKAAMACQYTLERIAHAIINFFFSTCGHYPNTDLLLGTLKAADENYVRLCEKSQEIVAKDAQYQAKEAQYQAKDMELQETKREYQTKEAAYQQEIQATRSELQRTTFEMQWRDLEVRTELEQQFVGQLQHQNEMLQQNHEIIQQNYEIIQQKDEMLQQKDEIIHQKDDMLQQKDEQHSLQIEMKSREVADLQRHIRSLMAELEKRQGSSGSDDEESSSSSSDVEHSSESDSTSDEFPIASCKVCLVKPSQIVFLPCKHLCCCDHCAARLRGKNCPICRERNLGYEKVYVI